jgi:PAS domain S-box-containing protein
MLDITKTKQNERSILLSNQIMKLFWESSNTKDYLTQVVDFLQGWCNCKCVGVRLTDTNTNTIPYVAYKGFDSNFIRMEGSLSLDNDNCSCIRIISGKPEHQELNILTPSGSFYLSNSIEFFNNLSKESQRSYRGICARNGFLTIAVIPIKHHQTIFGAVHITDKHALALSLNEIETLERIADLIGMGIYKFEIEERLRMSQNSLANAQKIARLGNWEWDIRNNELIWSDEVFSIFGKKPQGFKPTYKIFLSYIHPDDKDSFEIAIDQALYHKHAFNIEHRIVNSDETTGFVHQQAIVIFNEFGQPMKMSGTIQDITPRQIAETKIKEFSNYARTLFEVSPDPLLTIDFNGKIMDVNQAAQNTTGSTRSEMIGNDFANYFSEPTKAKEIYKKTFSEGNVRDCPLIIRNVNGNLVHVLLNATVYRNNDGNVQGVYAAGRDITQLRKVEDELHALSEKFVSAQENERKAISRELHDEIGQSLTALKILISQMGHQQKIIRQSSLKEAYSLASELLKQIREISLDLRPSMLDDLGLLPALIWHFERFTTQTGININFEHDGLQQIFSPEVNTTVYRIIQEALTNIARYADVKEASVRIVFNNNVLLIKIEDNGQGFSFTETNIKATAGLSGMRERVRLLEGKFTLNTAPRQGTCILVEIPILV